MRKRNLLMSALALVIVLGLTVGTSQAYFTDHVTATGRTTITLGDKTDIVEPSVPVTGNTAEKSIVVSNEGPESCYVRVKVFYPSYLDVTLETGANWTADEKEKDTYNYGVILAAGESASELILKIEGLPADAKDGDVANVVVVYESTKVTYDENGNPLPADWSMPAVIVETGAAKIVEPTEESTEESTEGGNG